MDKSMNQIGVRTKENMIEIIGPEEEDSNGEKYPPVIQISPYQVDALIEWLQEAKQELKGK